MSAALRGSVGLDRVKLGSLGLLTVLAVLTFLALTASSSFAAEKHVFERAFGEAGTGPGQFEDPVAAAVNSAGGEVYVVDKGNNRVERFSAGGAFLSQFDGAAAPTGAFVGPDSIAVDSSCVLQQPPLSELTTPTCAEFDPSFGDVYVYDSGHKVIDKFDEAGTYLGQIKEAEPGSLFGPINGIATDASGHLWVFQANAEPVGEEHEIDEFGNGGTNEFLSKRFDPLRVSRGFAVDSADDLYVDRGDETLAKLNPAAEPLVSRMNAEQSTAAAVDLTDDHVYIYNQATGENAISAIDQAATCTASNPCGLAPSSSLLERFGADFGAGDHLSTGSGLAVNSTDATVYAVASATDRVVAFESLSLPDVETATASEVKPTTATLNGTVDPDGVPLTACTFEWGETEAFGQTATCNAPDATEVGAGAAPVPVHAALSGLKAGTTYFLRLTAANANGANPGNASQNQTFTTSGARIDSTSTSNVTATAATLEASIDPNGSPTSYFFQYGTTTAYGSTSPQPPGPVIGAGTADVDVASAVQGLSPATTYHYRVVARREVSSGVFEEFPGPDTIFTTQTSAAATLLPDDRQWEVVSPPQKHGGVIGAIGEAGLLQAAANGDAVSYFTNSPTEATAAGSSNEVQILSRRLDSGWASEDIAGPNAAATGVSAGKGNEYRYFSLDLANAIVQPLGNFLPLSAAASEQTPYLRTDFPSGLLGEPCSTGCYRPLVTGCPLVGACPRPIEEAQNVPAGTVFANNRQDAECGAGAGPRRDAVFNCRPRFDGATPDLEHVIFESEVDLTPGVPGSTGRDLYEWGSGTLTRVGAITLLGELVFHAISADGSRVVFDGTSKGLNGLLLRDTATESTVQLDAANPSCHSGCVNGGGIFQTATPDGSHIYFTDENRLTEDAGAEAHAPDLYECRIIEGAAGAPECLLTDLTPAGPAGEPARAQGVLGASADGSWVYYAAGPVNAPQVYVRHGGMSRPVATLSVNDSRDWERRLKYHTARVSADGEWLAFMSQQSLKGYDTHDAVTGEPDTEAYLYNGVDGKLECASCDPTGARPVGIEYQKISGAISGGDRILEFLEQGVAAIIPGGIPITGEQSLYQPRYLSDSGRLFFNSHDALVPQDTNGTFDVYEYEPPGIGSCTAGSPAFAPSNGGCVDLISSGTSPLESAFLDASESGNDVFFLTNSRLAPQDTDSERDVYDAHVCSGEAPCLPEPAPPAPVCSGDACQLPATPPVDATPGSLTFSGAGNVVRCPKGKKLSKGKCVKKQKTKKHKKHHKSAHGRSAKSKRGSGK
jgi:hypothetical protein